MGNAVPPPFSGTPSPDLLSSVARSLTPDLTPVEIVPKFI